jgi:hypothetical protein
MTEGTTEAVTEPLDPLPPETVPPVSAAPAAHRRPGLVAFAYAYRALAGVLMALPAAAAIGGATASWPRGQRVLFDRGGVMLLESIRLARRALAPVELGAGAVAVVALIFGIFPLAALLVGLGREGRLPAAFLAGRAWSHAGTLALLFGVAALAQAIAGAILALLGEKLVGTFAFGALGHDVADAAVSAVVLAVILIVGVLRDLACVAAVRGEHRFYMAAVGGLRCARRAGGRALGAWAWRASLGLAGLGLAAWLAPSLAGASAGAVAVGALLHQAAIVGVTFARASWLAAAMRLYDASARS